MAPALSEEDYTIDIICALPLERTAVEAMLDQKHEKLPKQTGDNNVYTFGSFGTVDPVHNVVVASLPRGDYGLVAASGVANDVRRSFPSIKLGLMVGIAGGVPRPGSESGDVRLGDVVVGCAKGVPSVVNYDLGKEDEGGFDIRSELSEPPDAIQKAIAALEVQHQSEGPTYLTYLARMLNDEKNKRLNTPRIKGDYFNKPDAPDAVKQCRRLRDPPADLGVNKFVELAEDGSPQYPQVHIGSIASANRLMKKAKSRDATCILIKDQKKAEILCYEMEASGIVKNWPCLVIRGICDYCDEEKNKDWQNFAAATAAAYMKDLLLILEADDVEKEPHLSTKVEETPEDVPQQGGFHFANTGTGRQRNYVQGGGSNNRQYNADRMNIPE